MSKWALSGIQQLALDVQEVTLNGKKKTVQRKPTDPNSHPKSTVIGKKETGEEGNVLTGTLQPDPAPSGRDFLMLYESNPKASKRVG